jgi:hypothetical protein
MRHLPLLDIPHGRTIDFAGDDTTIQVHGSARSCVMGMKVRRRVAALNPVHVDRYSSEVADARHAPMSAPSHLRPAATHSGLGSPGSWPGGCSR